MRRVFQVYQKIVGGCINKVNTLKYMHKQERCKQKFSGFKYNFLLTFLRILTSLSRSQYVEVIESISNHNYKTLILHFFQIPPQTPFVEQDPNFQRLIGLILKTLETFKGEKVSQVSWQKQKKKGKGRRKKEEVDTPHLFYLFIFYFYNLVHLFVNFN